MKNLLFILFIFLGFNNVKAQEVSYKQDTMEHINIEDFKKGNYTNEHGDFIQQFKSLSTGDDYVQNISSQKSPLEALKQFHENTHLRKKNTIILSFSNRDN